MVGHKTILGFMTTDAKTSAETITLPKADLDGLLERIEDLEARLALDRTRDEESLPDDVMGRLLNGENPVRVFREHRGLTATALSEASGVGKSYLSEIEKGKKPGSVDALRKIADALDVDLDDLVA